MQTFPFVEKQKVEFKDLQKIRTGDKGFRDLAITCVAFANAQGGKIYVGYDDKTCAPKPAPPPVSSRSYWNRIQRLTAAMFCS